jgi:hypothetical protein
MMTTDHRVRKRIFTNQPQKTSFWSHLLSFVSSVSAVVFGAIIAMLFAEHLESGSTVGNAMSSWFNWFTSHIAGVDPFVTVAVLAVLGLVGLAFYARDH